MPDLQSWGFKMDCKEIIEEYLKKNGYDGLVGDECGCCLDDLMPCGECCHECEPALDTNKYYERIKAIQYPEHPKRPAFPKQSSTPEEIRKYADDVEAYNKTRTEWAKKANEYQEKHDLIIDESNPPLR